MKASDASLALEAIRTAAPAVMQAVEENFPSPFEIDTEDEEAIRRLLAAIVEAAERP